MQISKKRKFRFRRKSVENGRIYIEDEGSIFLFRMTRVISHASWCQRRNARDKLVYRLVASHSFTGQGKRKPKNSPFCKRKINQCETRPPSLSPIVTKFNEEPLQFQTKIHFEQRSICKKKLLFRNEFYNNLNDNLSVPWSILPYSLSWKMWKSFLHE